MQKALKTALEEVKADAEEAEAAAVVVEEVEVAPEQKMALLATRLSKSPMSLFARTSPEERAVDVNLEELHLVVVETH